MKNIPKYRDHNAMAACLRTGGFMKDRREPRGGSRNYQAEFLEDAMEEMVCDFCGKPSAAIRRIALDDGYDRITTKTPAKYACSVCSDKKEETRLARIVEMVSEGV